MILRMLSVSHTLFILIVQSIRVSFVKQKKNSLSFSLSLTIVFPLMFNLQCDTLFFLKHTQTHTVTSRHINGMIEGKKDRQKLNFKNARKGLKQKKRRKNKN